MAFAPMLAKCRSTDSLGSKDKDDDEDAHDDSHDKVFERGANMFSNARVKCKYLEKALAVSAHQHGLQDSGLSRKSAVSRGGSVNSQLKREYSFFSMGRPSMPPTPSSGFNERSTHTDEFEYSFEEMAEIKQLFLPESARYLHPQHIRLARVVRHIFSSDIDNDIELELPRAQTVKTVGKIVEQMVGLVPPVPNPVKKANTNLSEKLNRFSNDWITRYARRVINNPVVSSFFFILTVYVLFGPDLVVRYGSKDWDHTFMVIITVIFFFFVVEVILSLLGRKDYILFPLILDSVALVSLVGDTWFFQGGSDGNIQDRLVVARSSRLTRLTRMVRIARVTRLVPHLMKLMSRKSMEFSRALLEKKLWRVFLFLDTDEDGLLCNFDLKCFYMVLLQQDDLVRETPKQLLRADVDVLVRTPDKEDAVTADFSPRLDFAEFYKVMFATKAGQNVWRSLHDRVFNAAGVATLTQRISDSVAMKICVGIVITAIVMQAFPGQEEDHSVQQYLQMLVEMAKFEHSRGIESAHMELCPQVASVRHHVKLLFLHLESWTYLDAGQCHAGISAVVMKPFDRISSIIDELNLREAQVMTFCWPDFKDCSEHDTSSVILVDTTREVHDAAMSSIWQTITLIVLLLIFAYVFSYFLGRFSKRLLVPLQAFVDDMTAMSCLELVQLDLESKELPVVDKRLGENDLVAFLRNGGTDMLNKMQGTGGVKMVDELVHLQKAFGLMKGAVRSWSKYVPPAVVQCLFDAGMEATVGVTKCLVSILFCDIDDFDQQICHSPAEEVMSLLTKVLGSIADVIEDNGGTLLEFIGDETLAAFNAPCGLRHHVRAAATAALQIHEAIDSLPQLYTMKEFNGRMQLVETHIRCRCGVHTATILAGNIGSISRMKYGLLGDGINLTARLKGLNTKYNTKTLSTEKVLTNDACRRSFIARPVDKVAVKGRSEPTTVYEMLGFLRAENKEHLQALAKKHSEAFRLYQKQSFAEAKVLFNDVTEGFQAQGHTDEPSLQLARRCDRYLAEPPPEGWDGVERLKAKLFQVEEAPKTEPKVDSEPKADFAAELQDETKGGVTQECTQKPALESEPTQKEEDAPALFPAPKDTPGCTEEPEPPSGDAPLLLSEPQSPAVMDVSTLCSNSSTQEGAEVATTAAPRPPEDSGATKLVVIPGCVE